MMVSGAMLMVAVGAQAVGGLAALSELRRSHREACLYDKWPIIQYFENYRYCEQAQGTLWAE